MLTRKMTIRMTIVVIVAVVVSMGTAALFATNPAGPNRSEAGKAGGFAIVDAADASAQGQLGQATASILRTLPQGEPEILLSAQGVVQRSVEAPDGRIYSQLSVPGCGTTAEDIGYPEVPFKGFFLEIPYGVDVSVAVLDRSVSSLGKGYLICPRQRPEAASGAQTERKFEINETAYSGNLFLPTVPVVIGKPGFIRGRRVVFVQVFPLQYNPVSGELRAFSSVRFRLVYKGKPDVNGEARKSRLATIQSETLAKDLIMNYKKIPPKRTPGPQVLTMELSTGNAADYLIIVADSFYEEVLPLAEWKHKKGFITRVTKTSEIDDDPNKDDIKNYIQDAYDTWDPAPSYVLLVGDSQDVPPHYHTFTQQFLNCYTDHPYACVDGTDYFPDLTIGRLPVHTESDCTNVVNKILTYDRTPDDGDWYDNYLSAAYFQDSGTCYFEQYCVSVNDGIADRWFMETAATARKFLLEETDYTVQTAWVTTYWPLEHETYHFCDYKDYGHRSELNLLRWGVSPYPDPVPGYIVDLWESEDDARIDVNTAINNGVGLVQHCDHGNVTLWGDPYYTVADIDKLSNGVKTPVVFSINCSTGEFTDPSGDCFCERFLKKSPGGCVGTVGASSFGWDPYCNLLTHGFYVCFWPTYDRSYSISPSTVSWRPAEALAYAKQYMYTYEAHDNYMEAQFYVFHWFGDPEMMLRTKTPAALSVSHPDAVVSGPTQPVDMMVTVTQAGEPVQGALVAITHPTAGQDYWVGSTGRTGKVNFSNIILSDQTEDYDIVVTAHDSIPYEGKITAYSTVQAAINGAANGDEIEVWPGTYYERIDFKGKAITLRSSNPEDPSVVAATVINGNSAGTVVKFKTAEGVNSVLTGFTITGGYAMGSGEYGGGIYCYYASPTVSNCVVADNYAGSTWGFNNGGGMLNRYSSPTVVNCTFSGNSTNGYGGGIANWDQSNPTVTNSTLHGNSAQNGGGMSSYQSTPTVTNCTFSANTSNNLGGGMFNTYNSPQITNCVFTGNSAGGTYGYGGAIYNASQCSPQITNCIFVENDATDRGGAIYVGSYSSPALTACTFSNNYAGNYGGAIYSYTSSNNVGVTNSILWNDSAGISGHEIYTGYPSTVTVTYSDIKGGWSGTGNINADPLFVAPGSGNYHLGQYSPCINTGDPAYSPDPGEADIDGDPRIVRTAVDMGADEVRLLWYVDAADGDDLNDGKSWEEAFETITKALNSTVDWELVEVAEGTYYEEFDFGGKKITVRSTDPDDWDVVGATIIDGSGASDGAVVYFTDYEDSSSVLTGFTITGGADQGLYCEDSSPTVSNCLVTYNGSSDDGGGMHNNDSSPTVVDCVFSHNSAGEFGGGMYNYDSSPIVTDCVFAENEAEENGAGISNDYHSSPKITNCVFHHNYCDDYGGGVFNYDGSSPTLINCTFIGNAACLFGGGMYNRDDSNPEVINCVFYYNDCGDEGEEIYNDDSSPIFSYCNVDYGLNGDGCGGDPSLDGGGNIHGSPRFVDKSDGEGADGQWGTCDDGLRIESNSACKDAGDNYAVPDDITMDIKGSDRIINGTVDIGAYEYDPGC